MNRDKSFINKKFARDLGFKSFLLYLNNNSFDRAVENLINEKIKNINIISQDVVDDENLLSVIINEIFIEEEIMALIEMKIINSYRQFEVHLKFLIKSWYSDFDKSNNYKWEDLKNFLKLKGINLNKIENYNEINELREVNNAIKHSHILKSRIVPLELKNKENIKFVDVLKFYKRIEITFEPFFISLQNEIEKEQYVFDDLRLNCMADELVNRMDNATISKYIKVLKSKIY